MNARARIFKSREFPWVSFTMHDFKDSQSIGTTPVRDQPRTRVGGAGTTSWLKSAAAAGKRSCCASDSFSAVSCVHCLGRQ
eukprot:IDg3996t1